MSVSRVKVSTSASMVKEHWTSETEQEILDLFESVKRAYPEMGYGTMLYNVRQDPTGLLYHADFSRSQSCD